MKIIDTHVHLCDDESFRHTLDLVRSAGIEKIVVSCLEPCDGVYKPTPDQFREDNSRVYGQYASVSETDRELILSGNALRISGVRAG